MHLGRRAPLGAAVGYAGPARGLRARATDADWLLLCGDETALPAIAAILESPPAARTSSRVVEVARRATRSCRARPAGVPLGAPRRRARRDHVSHLADALRELPLPDGLGQAWGAAESRVARDLRAVLRDERGLPQPHATAHGYWLRSGDWVLDE